MTCGTSASDRGTLRDASDPPADAEEEDDDEKEDDHGDDDLHLCVLPPHLSPELLTLLSEGCTLA